MIYDPNTPPYEFEKDGVYMGMTSDIVASIERRLKIKVTPIRGVNWDDSLDKLRSGDVAMIVAMVRTPERESYLLFTPSYISIPVAFMARRGTPPIEKLRDLEGRRVAVLRNMAVESYLISHTDTSKVSLYPVATLPEGITAVLEDRADYFAGNVAVTSWRALEMGATEFYNAGELPLPLELSIAVSPNYPLLHSALSKAVSSLSVEEIDRIKDRWIIYGGRDPIPKIFKLLIFILVTVPFLFLLLRQYMIRRSFRKMLFEERERLMGIIVGTNAGTWEWNIQSGSYLVNEKFFEIIECDKHELETFSFDRWSGFIHPADQSKVGELLELHLSGVNDSYVCELRVLTSLGKTKWCIQSGRIISHTKDNRPLMMTGVIIDITDKKEAFEKNLILQEQLHQSQKMEAVGQLAGGVAHDFNNALGAIMGAVELLKMDCSPSEKEEYFNMILTASERAAELTKKLLTFSRKGAKVSTAIDVLSVVQDTAALLSHTIDKSITISFENRASQTSIIGDNSMLQNALMNMGINASHAMPEGGLLTFGLENVELDSEYCELSSFDIIPGNYLVVSIRDTGCGIYPEVEQHIFEPFFTTKEEGKGTGLGMAAVYGAVQGHGGAITLYSEVGNGTVFHIYLPLASESVVREIDLLPNFQGSGRILVMDDDELIRITASDILKSMGYEVILAENGHEGIEILREKREEVDLIILDMIMPSDGGP